MYNIFTHIRVFYFNTLLDSSLSPSQDETPWLSKHPLIQRAHALVSSVASPPAEEGQPRAARDLPNEVALLPPALPEGIGSDSAESPLELHASGDSDLGEASPPRNWRIYNELPGRSTPVSNGPGSHTGPVPNGMFQSTPPPARKG